MVFCLFNLLAERQVSVHAAGGARDWQLWGGPDDEPDDFTAPLASAFVY